MRHRRPTPARSECRSVRDTACPVSTRGGTRLVRLVRGRGGGVGQRGRAGATARRRAATRARGACAQTGGPAVGRAPQSQSQLGTCVCGASCAGAPRPNGSKGPAPRAPSPRSEPTDARAPPRRARRGARDAACPISTGEGTQRVHLVRGKGRRGGGGAFLQPPAVEAPARPRRDLRVHAVSAATHGPASPNSAGPPLRSEPLHGRIKKGFL